MDVKEKLLENVKRAAYSCLPSNTEDFHLNMFVTDLLAHGVVAQEWISVKDRLPDKGGRYLIYQKAETWIGEVIQTAHWNETAQNFCGAQAGSFMEFVTHWMPLPQPPKGE